MEELLDIGAGGAFGILTRAQGPARRLAVVLFNAGLIHRVGPQRFHVDLARRLAAAGFDVLRFDLPGIGDAAMEGADAPQAVVAQAFDRLQAATGATGFVCGGICSAADLGWRMAVADARVRGLLLVDPLAVQGWWYRAGRLRQFLRTSPHTWPGKLLRRLARRPAADRVVAATEDYRDWPSPDAFRHGTARCLDRGVRILAVYTGGVADYLLHPRQIDETFGALRRHPLLRVEFRPGLDHILFAASDRRAALDIVAGWAGAAFDDGGD